MKIEKYFRELVSIPSPSKNEEQVSSYMKEKLTSFGYEFMEDSTGNLLFYKNKAGKKIMFEGHMDTVLPAVNAHLKEDDYAFFTDKTTALGADDKCALASLLVAAETYPEDDMVILLCVAEEIGLYGSRQLTESFFSDFDILGCYILDAQTSVGSIIKSAIGKTRLTITFKGKSSHAGFLPENGISAIVMASKFVTSIETGRLDSLTTSNIGSFISDGSTNVVPDRAVLTLEVRSDNTIIRNSIISEYREKAENAANEMGGTVDFFEESLYTEYSVPEDSPLIQRAIKAFASLGIKHQLKDTTGGSDANNLNLIGIPSVVLTSGYFNAHSVDEYMEKKELMLLYKAVMAIMESR